METFKFGPFPVETIFQIKFSESILVLINMRFKQRMQEIKIGKKQLEIARFCGGPKEPWIYLWLFMKPAEDGSTKLWIKHGSG